MIANRIMTRSPDIRWMVAADEHMVFGSDFPYSPARVTLAKKKHFDENKEYDKIRENIYSENAVELLKEEEL